MDIISITKHEDQSLKEDEVIRRILAGEKELYEILVRRNNQKLYRVIRGYFWEESEIEDVMQDAYVLAFTKLFQFKREAAFSTWLIRIAIHESLARLKVRKKTYQFLDHSQEQETNSILEIPDQKQLNPQDKMIQKEAKQLLEDAIDSLDTKYKSVYIMKEVEEMSLKEISTVLDITLANVKVRLHRSKEMLKERLLEQSATNNVFEFGFSRCDRITATVMNSIKYPLEE